MVDIYAGVQTERQTQLNRLGQRSTQLIIQNRDGTLIEDVSFRPQDNTYYAEVAAADIEQQTTLIERIIAMAFDVLGARHVEVRVQSDDSQN